MLFEQNINLKIEKLNKNQFNILINKFIFKK